MRARSPQPHPLELSVRRVEWCTCRTLCQSRASGVPEISCSVTQWSWAATCAGESQAAITADDNLARTGKARLLADRYFLAVDRGELLVIVASQKPKSTG